MNFAKLDNLEYDIRLALETTSNQVYCTTNDIANMSNVSYHTVSKWYIANGIEPVLGTVTFSGGSSSAYLYTLEDSLSFITDVHNRRPNYKTCLILENIHKVANLVTTQGWQPLGQIKLKYANQYGGHLDFPTKYGLADLVTTTSVYKFYPFKHWAKGSAEVQLMAIELNREPVLVLYGNVPDKVATLGEDLQQIGVKLLLDNVYDNLL